MLILLLLGGLVILFIYIASVAPNEPIYTKNLIPLVISTIIFSLILKILSLPLPLHNSKSNEIIILINNIPIITLAAIYLFITLVAVVQITKITTGPLRSQF